MSNAGKSTENIRENIISIRNSLNPQVQTLYYQIVEFVIGLNRASYHILDAHDDGTGVFEELLKEFDRYRDTMLSIIAPHIHKGNL